VGKYRPLGICLPKRWVFAQRGRPVTYQPDAEFDDLSETHKWRHVRYEAHVEPPIDSPGRGNGASK
jgi:hypothetical protein